jgi:Rhodopirellula transposase DDE domain
VPGDHLLKKTPLILSVLKELVAPETAGDPMTAQKWVRSSLRTLTAKLEAAGHVVSVPTLARLLRQLDYSLHVNAKKIETSSNHPDREQQFDYIAVQRAVFTAAGLPILSVDTKKKELVGNFKNVGQAWALEPTAVNVHDYPHDALGRAVPYGVYDVTRNRGFVCVGASGDTPAFAVDTISAWWQTEGNVGFPAADRLLLLADAGGSNGCQIRASSSRISSRRQAPGRC